uniref:Uncharacterized protein n=1 Tax=Denticeps clupeoides TaxID=299321 RepID=A0AAY4E059_9TELE
MVLKRILYSLLNSAHVVDRLAESRPIRRAAQITASAVTRAQLAGRDAAARVLRSETLRLLRRDGGPGDARRRAGRVRDAFLRELRQALSPMTPEMSRGPQ